MVTTRPVRLDDLELICRHREEMFRALKYRKIPTVMVRFPRETHELSRSGEPWHRIERLQHIVGWMDQWLMGKKMTAYGTVN